MANNTGTFFNVNDNDGIPLVGVSTDGKVMINHLYGNCLIGSTSVTGTSSQPLQVTGGAYVSGNLGIGTTNPTSKLQVIGSISASNILPTTDNTGVVGNTSFTWSDGQFTNLTVNDTLNVRAAIDLDDGDILRFGSSDDAYFSYDGTLNNFELQLEAAALDFRVTDNGTPRFIFTKSGNLGIGSTQPTSKLDVDGNVKVSGIITASSFTGDLTGTATTATNLSDATNITTGTINSSRLSGSYGISITGTATTANNVSSTININTSGIITASSFTGNITGTATTANNVSSTININTSGIVTATRFSGDGSTITGINASQWITYPAGISTTSNVGIGTTNPTTRISIAGTTGISFADSNIKIGDVDTGSSLIPTGDPNIINNGRGTNNFFAGLSAGKVTITGYYNNFIGWRAGYANTSGYSNNFIGVAAGYANTSGRGNDFIGGSAGFNNTTGNANLFIGGQAGQSNTTGSNNIFVGLNAGLGNQTGSQNVVIGSFFTNYFENPPILNGSNQLVIGAGSTAWIHGNSSYNVGFGTTNPTAKVHIGAATTSSAGSAPLKIGVGTTILATPEVGAIEYDGSFFYQTPNSTSGRAYVPPFYTFRRTSSGSAIGATIADFFTTPSSLSLEASSVYKITCFAYFTKSTAGTATWTHTFSSAPTVFTANLTYSPVTGIANGTQTNVLSYSGGQSTASMAHAATASLTTGVNHFAKFDIITVTNAATNWRLQLTQSAGTATPLSGSFYTIEKVGPSTGTFVA